jgi:hypothetical protein
MKFSLEAIGFRVVVMSAGPAEMGHEMLFGGKRVRVEIYLGWVGRDRRNVGSDDWTVYIFSAREKGIRRRRKEGKKAK